MTEPISEELLEKRLGSAMESVNLRIFNEKLRPLQTMMLRCSLSCSEDTSRYPGHEQMHNCQQRCVSSFNAAEGVVESELKQLQGRFERCQRDCADNVRDKLSISSTTPSDAPAARGAMLQCLSKCADSMIQSLPAFEARVRAGIEAAIASGASISHHQRR